MTGKKRHLFRLIVTNFINSLIPSAKNKLMGTDYFGTKYYETPLLKNSIKKRPARYFEPVIKEDFQQEIPAEWEAWLRYRRKEPPTEEEVRRNYEIIIMKKKNAAELENASREKEKALKSPVKMEEPQSFPVYEEYKNYGQDYEPSKTNRNK